MEPRRSRPTLILLGVTLIATAVVAELQFLDSPPLRGDATVRLWVQDPQGRTLADQPALVDAANATALGALLVVAEARGFEVAVEEYAGLGMMVVEIMGHRNEGACGWVYEVDGRSGDRSAADYTVPDGALVHWFWSCHEA